MFHIDKKSAIYADMRSEETGTPLAELADVLMRTKGVTFASQRFGTRVHAQRLGADSLMRLWKQGVAEREKEKKGSMSRNPDGDDGLIGKEILGEAERDGRSDEGLEGSEVLEDERSSRLQLKRVDQRRLQGAESRSVR